MQTLIALLRGINVGGHGKLPMQALVTLLEGLGARQVRTYIQSGNVVLQSPDPASVLEQALARTIAAQHGFTPGVLVLERAELARAIAENPFPAAEADPTTLHLGLLAAAPTAPDLDRLTTLRRGGERFQLKGRCFYLHAPEGIGRSKLAAAAERLLGEAMTVRNWKTVCKVMALAEG